MDILLYLAGFFAYAYIFISSIFIFFRIVLSGAKSVPVPERFYLGVSEEVDAILNSKFKYYSDLSIADKEKFSHRVSVFMEEKNFEGREGLVVTQEMKVLISASAVQLTFGLGRFHLDYFSTIVIYPKSYYSKLDKHFHMGEVNLNGVIVFSWDDYTEGYRLPNDRYNVGLHEMAHALKFDQTRRAEQDSFFANYYNRFLSSSKPEFAKLKRQEKTILRKYAGTNMDEFFAVCVEHFFEASAQFKEALPDLYKHMCILFNQDPLRLFNSEKSIRAELLPLNIVPEVDGSPLSTAKANRFTAIWTKALSFILVIIVFMDQLYSNPGLALFLAVVPLIGGALSFYELTDVEFFENHFCIKRPFFFSDTTFRMNYDNVLMATFIEGMRGSQAIVVRYFENGNLSKKKYQIKYIPNKDIQKMAELLISKNSIVRSNCEKWKVKGMTIFDFGD